MCLLVYMFACLRTKQPDAKMSLSSTTILFLFLHATNAQKRKKNELLIIYYQPGPFKEYKFPFSKFLHKFYLAVLVYLFFFIYQIGAPFSTRVL